MFVRLEATPAYKLVCDRIEREILSGRIQPGSQLPTETALAEQFGLTRHTVREGLRILEQGGLVRRETGRRLFAVLPHYLDLAPRLSRALVMQQVSFRELWEVARGLETDAAGSATERITGEQLAELESNLTEMAGRIAEGEPIIDLDVRFHSIIAEAACNRVLLLAREPVSKLFYPALHKIFSHPATREGAPQRLLDAHRRVFDGLSAQNVNLSRGWMGRHMDDFRRGYERCGLNLDAPISDQSL